MSFNRIPPALTFNHTTPDTVLLATQILEDLAVSNVKLDKINLSIEEEKCDINSFINKVERIVNVYNDNAQKINESNANKTQYEKRSMQQFLKEEYIAVYNSPRNQNSKLEYADWKSPHEKSELLRKPKILTKIEEESQVRQVGCLFQPLEEKIKRTISRLNTFAEQTTGTSLPEFTLITVVNEYGDNFRTPKLRKINAAPAETSLIETPKAEVPSIAIDISAPAVPKNPLADQELAIVAIETITAPAETIEAPAAPVAPKIDITVLLNLASGQTLAICCDPTWGEQPTLFTKNEGGWKGEAPLNQDWKFVILKEGKVTQWEQGKNRRCNDQIQAFTVKANEVRF